MAMSGKTLRAWSEAIVGLSVAQQPGMALVSGVSVIQGIVGKAQSGAIVTPHTCNSSRCRAQRPHRLWRKSALGDGCLSHLITHSKSPGQVQDVSESMEDILEQHARRMLDIASRITPPSKYLVAIAGAPGSGKTTSAQVTCYLLNQLGNRNPQNPLAVVASMDGFHYYRRQLDEMDDPEEAHARRGAHWTFDASAFVDAMKELRERGQVVLPSFDHAIGDPVENDIHILPEHRIVLIEGNYVLLDEHPWRELASLMDESWFISADIDTAMNRVVARQVGNGSDLLTAQWRVTNNDRLNAELILHSSARATYIIPSLPYKGPGLLNQLALNPEE